MNTTNPAQTSEVKLKYLLAYLRDRARDEADQILENNLALTFQEMITGLKEVFSNPQRRELSRQQLRNCTQNHGESVDEFITRIRMLAKKCRSDWCRA